MSPSPRLVFFDLEATGLKNEEIIQIGAVDFKAKESFNEFVHPAESKTISPYATDVNKIVIQDGVMYKLHEVNDKDTTKMVAQLVYTKEPKDALEAFGKWIKDKIGGKVILVAYNGIGFDAKLLLKEMKTHNIDFSFIQGFSDPYQLGLEYFPNLKARKQADLLKTFKIEESAPAHDAMGDAENLRRLTKAMVAKIDGRSGQEAEEAACLSTLHRPGTKIFADPDEIIKKHKISA